MFDYEVAVVEDRGGYWEVVNVTTGALATADEAERILRLSHISYKKIEKAIRDGNRVKITKPVQFQEVLPNEIEVLEIDANDIKHNREHAVKRVRSIVTPELASISGLSMYGFICLNNELSDKGFFITDGNREAKYLEILETGDEALINKLETYLNYRDEIARVAYLNVNFDNFRNKVNAESDPKQLIELADTFLEDFYSRY